MGVSDRQTAHDDMAARRRSFPLRTLACGLAMGAVVAGLGAPAGATNYNEGAQGDLSNLPGSPTNIGALTLGDNFIVGSTIPTGDVIPDSHGARQYPDDEFFTFTVAPGEVLTQFNIVKDTSILTGDRFFLGIYSGATSPVNPANPTPAGLLGYTLPGPLQIGTDVLPALAASNTPGFPQLPHHFSGSLGPGAYTVWLVDGNQPVHYDLDLKISAAPEPETWVLMVASIGLVGAGLRTRRRAMTCTASA